MATTVDPDATVGARATVGAGAQRLPPRPGGLAVIAVGQLMVAMDTTLLAVALPEIRLALGFSTANLSWVLNAYLVTFAGLLLLGRGVADRFGGRRTFVVGAAVFAAGALAGGLAQDSGTLLAMRAVQGIGAALVSPSALLLVTTGVAEGPARERALAVYAATTGAGVALGLLLGGLVVDLLSWRWVLLLNAPVALVLAIAAGRAVPDAGRRIPKRLDGIGAAAVTAGMALLVYGLVRSAAAGWSAASIAAVAAATVLLTAFVAAECATADPLVPLRVFRSRLRAGSYLVMAVTGTVGMAVFFFLVQYLQTVKGFTPPKAGCGLLPMSAAVVITAPAAGRLVTKVGPQPLVLAGLLGAGFGMALLSSLTPTSSYPLHVLPAIGLVGAGLGLVVVPVAFTAGLGVQASDAGVAAAMLNITQQVGAAIGLAVLVAVFGAATPHGSQSVAHFSDGAAAAFRAAAFVTLAGFIVGIGWIRVLPAGRSATAETVEG